MEMVTATFKIPLHPFQSFLSISTLLFFSTFTLYIIEGKIQTSEDKEESSRDVKSEKKEQMWESGRKSGTASASNRNASWYEVLKSTLFISFFLLTPYLRPFVFRFALMRHSPGNNILCKFVVFALFLLVLYFHSNQACVQRSELGDFGKFYTHSELGLIKLSIII